MTTNTNDLEYLTIDSIQWANGHVRSRMPLEEKRAKHRVHQQHFVERQRRRLDQLRREVQRHELQLRWLRATKEAEVLRRENEIMGHELTAEGPNIPQQNDLRDLPVTVEEPFLVMPDALLPLPELELEQVELEQECLTVSWSEADNEAVREERHVDMSPRDPAELVFNDDPTVGWELLALWPPVDGDDDGTSAWWNEDALEPLCWSVPAHDETSMLEALCSGTE